MTILLVWRYRRPLEGDGVPPLPGLAGGGEQLMRAAKTPVGDGQNVANDERETGLQHSLPRLAEPVVVTADADVDTSAGPSPNAGLRAMCGSVR